MIPRTLLVIVVACLLISPMPARSQGKLMSADLDRLVLKEMTSDKSPAKQGATVDDITFLRRVSLDLIGRPPTAEEQSAFRDDSREDKRRQLVDRLLASPEFGVHWGNYWSDTVAARVPPPELTFLNYKWFKGWLVEEFNKNTPWDEVVREMLTATGKIKERPATTFVGYHQGRANKLAAETARIFLGIQLQCAECHDHKFEAWKREEFHGLAAFFARSSGKLGKDQDGGSTIVTDAGKGEHVMPNAIDPRKKAVTMAPAMFTGEKLPIGANDQDRRKLLAEAITKPSNPYFAKAYVNRIWARMMGRGFYEPVDNIAETTTWLLPAVHDALSSHFVASKYDIKDFFRLLANSSTYQMDHTLGEALADKSQSIHNDLSADEVFRSLQQAVGLKNVTPPARKPTSQERFPPPPMSTRDVIACKFCYDPSLSPEEVTRTMGQAMLLMNNKQIQDAINADPKSGTQLSKLLQETSDNREAVIKVFEQVLSRRPRDQEITIALDHLNEVGQRGEAFEDLVWSLINSAEFTMKR